MEFQTADIQVIKQKWIEENLGSIAEFWMMIAAESYSRHPQSMKKHIATTVLERGRFQKVMLDEFKDKPME